MLGWPGLLILGGLCPEGREAVRVRVCVCVRVVLPASHTHNHSTQTINLANTITPWNVIERRSAGISGHKV